MALSPQRLFHHLRVPYGPEGELSIPLVILLHRDDVARLSPPAVPAGAPVADVLAILRLHGASILPLMAPGGGAVVLPAPPAGGRGAPAPAYHGKLLTATFALRPGDEGGCYTLMTHDATAAAAGLHLRPTPVASFSLLCSVAHKEADVERRRAALAVHAPGGAAAGGAAAAAVASSSSSSS